MAVDCDPGTLVTDAGCLQCLTPQQQLAIQTYLLQQLLGESHDPDELATLAKCFDCLTIKQLLEIQVYLLCQIVNMPAPADCVMLEDDGDPTGVVTPEFEGQLYHDTTNDTYYYSTGTTSADWTAIGGAPVACVNQSGAGDPT